MANSLQSQISRQDSSIFLTLEPCSIRRIPAAGSASMRRKTRKEARYVNFWTNSLNTLSKKYEVWRMKYYGRIQAAGSASMSRKAWKEVRCVDFWTNSFEHFEYEVWSMKIEAQWKNTSCRICLYDQEDKKKGEICWFWTNIVWTLWVWSMKYEEWSTMEEYQLQDLPPWAGRLEGRWRRDGRECPRGNELVFTRPTRPTTNVETN